MDLIGYLNASAELGPLGWAFFILQIAVAVGGAYLAFLRGDSHPVRGPALRRLGYALLVLGAIGTLLGALRIGAVAPFNTHLWFYLVALFEVALAAYALVYRRGTYAADLARFEQTSRGRGAARGGRPQPALSTNGNGRIGATAAGEPRSIPTTSRRDSRRERKRKK